MHLQSLRVLGRGAVAAEFTLDGRETPVATTFTVNEGKIATASARPDVLQDFRGTAEELRSIVSAVIAFSRAAV